MSAITCQLRQAIAYQRISVPGTGYSRAVGVYHVGEVPVLDVPVRLAQHRRLHEVDRPPERTRTALIPRCSERFAYTFQPGRPGRSERPTRGG